MIIQSLHFGAGIASQQSKPDGKIWHKGLATLFSQGTVFHCPWCDLVHPFISPFDSQLEYVSGTLQVFHVHSASWN